MQLDRQIDGRRVGRRQGVWLYFGRMWLWFGRMCWLGVGRSDKLVVRSVKIPIKRSKVGRTLKNLYGTVRLAVPLVGDPAADKLVVLW